MKKIHKIIKLVIVAFLLITMLPMSEISAATGTLQIDTSHGWTLGGTSYGTEGLMTIGGKTVYCLERTKTYHSGTVYTATEDWVDIGISDSEQRELSLISYFASQRAKSTGNEDWHAVAQSLIWKELGSGQGWVLSPTFNTKTKLDEAMNTLLDDVKQYEILPSFDFKTYDIKVGETIRLEDTNKVLSTFKVVSGDGLQTSIEGNTLVVTATSDSADLSSIIYRKNISLSDTGVSIMYDAGPSVQKVGSFLVGDPNTGFIDFNVEKFGNLELVKSDEIGNVIEGVTFTFSKNSDMSSPIGSYTTDATGKISIKDIEPTTYYYQEISAPGHLEVDSTIKSIVVEPSNTSTITATNTIKVGSLELFKINEAGDFIDGAVFNVKSLDAWNPYNENHTITNGNLVVHDLYVGSYQIMEVSAPEHHEVTKEVFDIEITEGNTTKQTIVNRINPHAKIIINKSMEGNLKDTTGVEFTLTAKEDIYDILTLKLLYSAGDEIGIYALDGKETIEIDYLPIGKYQLQETSTALGYELDTKVYDIHFRQEDYVTAEYTHTVEIENKLVRTQIEVVKLDAVTSNPVLNETEFTMYTDKELTNVHQVKTTDPMTASVIFDDLVFGSTYYIKETNAPEGYLVGDEVREVVIDDAYLMQRSIKIEAIANEKPTGTIELQKHLENLEDINSPLLGGGVTFQLTANMDIVSPDTGEVLYSEGDLVSVGISEQGQYVTDELGRMFIGELPLGTNVASYKLEEISTIEGYQLLEEPIIINFEITDEITLEYVEQVEVTNQLLTTDIVVNKVDSVTKQNIMSKEFEFTMYADEACTEVLEVVQANSEDGTATFKDVKYGQTVYIKETKAPLGYKLSDEVKTVVTDMNLEGIGDVHSFEYQNILLPVVVQSGDSTTITTYLVIFGVTTIILGCIYFSRKKYN